MKEISSFNIENTKRSYLGPQAVSEGLSTLIFKEILRCVFLEGSGLAKVMSSEENFTSPEGTYWISENHQIMKPWIIKSRQIL